VQVEAKAGELSSVGDVELMRPAGPLAELLWPTSFPIDGAGRAYLPALEAGEHTVRLGKDSRTFKVLPLSTSGGEPTIVRFEPAR
jgi:hypothetical protein